MNTNDLKVETSTVCKYTFSDPDSAELETIHSPPLPGNEGVNSEKSGDEQETTEETSEEQTKEEPKEQPKEETKEEITLESLILDDLSDDEVNEKYKDHPGYPRDAASRERYYKYVYPDQSNLYDNVPKKNRKYYRVTDHKEYRESPYLGYRGFVFQWFSGNWKRYPKLMTDEEVESLDPVSKQRYIEFCEEIKDDNPENTVCYFEHCIKWRTYYHSYKETGEFKFIGQ